MEPFKEKRMGAGCQGKELEQEMEFSRESVEEEARPVRTRMAVGTTVYLNPPLFVVCSSLETAVEDNLKF